jgi:hypothetical protein
MRVVRAVGAALVLGVWGILGASCVQVPDPADAPQEPTGEAEEDAYETTFHFTIRRPDDGKGDAGGWQEASTILKFGEWRRIFPYYWKCPVTVGMPIRTKFLGRVSGREASVITADITTEVTEKLMHSRPSWDGFGEIYCQELRSGMGKLFQDRHPLLGAKVSRL